MTFKDGLAGSGWDGHLLLLYDSEPERRAGLAAWVRRGLDLDEKVICTEAPGVAAEDSVRMVLDEHDVDVAAATADGRLAMLPLAEFYPPAGQVPVVERALAEGFTRVRMTAEASAALGLLTESDYARIERTMDELCRTRPVSAMCQYERSVTSAARLREIVAVHLVGIRESGFRTRSAEDGIAVSGEVDISNADTFAAAVDAAVQAAGSPIKDAATEDATTTIVRLDLGDVCFVDVAACRALVTSTQWFRHGGGRVLVVAPQPAVERTLRMLDIDQLPGLEIINGDA
jgi:anti-anti-sigma factor